MSRIFISYSRRSQDVARNIVNDIQALGCTVWLDQDLSGGQAWWDQILSIIRDSDVFVFVLDADGLNSAACQREFGYAAALGKPVLPVLVADGLSTNLLPPELSRLQFIDYRNQDRKSAFCFGQSDCRCSGESECDTERQYYGDHPRPERESAVEPEFSRYRR